MKVKVEIESKNDPTGDKRFRAVMVAAEGFALPVMTTGWSRFEQGQRDHAVEWAEANGYTVL